MSFKQFVPDTSQDWDTYWNQTSIDRELDIVKTDGLNPIFKRYLKKSGTNLEAGCGLGKWVLSLHNQGYYVIGLDTYVKGLKKLGRHNPVLALMAGDVENLGLANDSLDSYISLGVVEHFESGPHQALAEAFRTLKPGGIAFIEVPFDSPLRQLTRIWRWLLVTLKTPARILVETLNLRSPRPHITFKFYEYRYTVHELKSFVNQTGFDLIEVLPKDDLAPDKSIMLWSDYPKLRNSDGSIFHLNPFGRTVKTILDILGGFTYSALIVAVCKKPV